MVRVRGFNLIELAVASAMAGIIAAAAVASFGALNRQLIRLQSESVASDNAKSLVDLLVTDLQGVGGGPIRPWMALRVQNAEDSIIYTQPSPPAPSTSVTIRPDRLTYATLLGDAPTCPLTAAAPAATGFITSAPIGPSCCLQDLLTASGGVAHVYLIRGGEHRQVSFNSVVTGVCTANVVSGPLAAIDNSSSPNLDHFLNGSVVAASIRTIYLSATNVLSQYEESDLSGIGDPLATPAESTRIAGDVYDFQVSLGYDNNADGRVEDTASTSDEWRFNVVAETGASETLPAGFSREGLRMVNMGVVIGVSLTDPDYTSKAKLVGSQEFFLKKVHLRATSGKAALRNLFLFL